MKKKRLHLTTLLCLLFAVMLFITGCSADSDENPANTSFTVTFNAGDGTFDDGKTTITKEVYDGEKVTEPTAPAKEGYSLVHWYAKSEDSPFDFENTPITCDITLYAKWAEGYAPDNLAAAIRALAENSAAKNVLLKATGTTSNGSNFFTGSNGIRAALLALKDKAPDILVTLDLSDVRGLSTVPSGAFYTIWGQCTNLEGIILPDSITSINSDAFKGCTSLTSVTFTEKSQLTSIGDWAFDGCTSLTNVKIPEGVTNIGDWAFDGCTSLTNVTFGKNSQLTSIGHWAFAGCTSLTNVKIPEGVTNIDNGAFDRCESLASVTFAENSKLTSIGQYVFRDCTSLTSVKIPEGVTNIDHGVFEGCESLANVTFAENSKLANIGVQAFRECTSLTSVEIPEGVTNIDEGAFDRCESLASVTFAENSKLTSIGQYAFDGCTSLTSVEIPEGVTNIGRSAFDGCTSLDTIIFTGTMEQWHKISFSAYWHYNTPATKVTCIDGEVDL